jgi:hypothetical protein
MEDGRELLANSIISDVGVFNTFGHLLSPDHPASVATLRALGSVTPSSAHLCLYVGMKQAAPEGTNPWVLPSYVAASTCPNTVGDVGARGREFHKVLRWSFTIVNSLRFAIRTKYHTLHQEISESLFECDFPCRT